jgi:hypothetical protein
MPIEDSAAMAQVVDALVETVRQLTEREAIRDLKARYCRLLDAKDWDGVRGLFTPDACLDVRVEGIQPVVGADAIVSAVRQSLELMSPAHHAHGGEITLLGPTRAQGTWALGGFGQWQTDGVRHVMRTYGWYDETYEKGEDGWRISVLRLRDVQVDLFSEPVPS